MKAVFTGSSGIDKQHIIHFGIPDYFQDVGVSADKEIGYISNQIRPDNRIIPGWRSTNVRHPDEEPFQLKALIFRAFLCNLVVIDVAKNRPQGLEGPQLINDFQRTDVSGMPDFIAVSEVRKELRI